MREYLPKLCFFHVAKCGGTSILHQIAKHYERSRVLQENDINRAVNSGQLSTYGDLLKYVKKSEAILGHIQVDQIIDDSFIKITMIRDPFERLLSLYRYYQATPDEQCEREGGNGEVKRSLRGRPVQYLLELKDFLSAKEGRGEDAGLLSFLENEFSNHMTRRFSCLERVRDTRGIEKQKLDESEMYLSPGFSLQEAKRVIGKFDKIGFSERSDEFFQDLSELFNSPPPSNRMNVTASENPHVYNHTEQELEVARTELREWFEVDQELYDYATKLESDDVASLRWQSLLDRVRTKRPFGYVVPSKGRAKRFEIRDKIFLSNITGRADMNILPSVEYFVSSQDENGIYCHFVYPNAQLLKVTNPSLNVKFELFSAGLTGVGYNLEGTGCDIRSWSYSKIRIDGVQCISLAAQVLILNPEFSIVIKNDTEQIVLVGIEASSKRVSH